MMSVVATPSSRYTVWFAFGDVESVGDTPSVEFLAATAYLGMASAMRTADEFPLTMPTRLAAAARECVGCGDDIDAVREAVPGAAAFLDRLMDGHKAAGR